MARKKSLKLETVKNQVCFNKVPPSDIFVTEKLCMDERGNLYFKSGKPFHEIEKKKIEEINCKIAYLKERQEQEVEMCANNKFESVTDIEVMRLSTLALATDILKEFDKIVEGGLTLQQATAILESFHMTLEINYRQMSDVKLDIT